VTNLWRGQALPNGTYILPAYSFPFAVHGQAIRIAGSDCCQYDITDLFHVVDLIRHWVGELGVASHDGAGKGGHGAIATHSKSFGPA
jgi:hypothetical protein